MNFSDLGTLCPVRCSDIIITKEGYVELSGFDVVKTILDFSKKQLIELA
jgi:hypothetical protein